MSKIRPRSTWTNKYPSRDISKRVDAVFHQWRTERPDIDPSPVYIYGLLAQLYFQTTAFINEALAPYALHRGTFDVLTALRRSGTPYQLTPKQLTTELLLSAAGLTSRLNHLEERYLIARLPEPNDRRTVRVQLTAAGEALVNEVIPVVFKQQWRSADLLGPDEWKQLATGLSDFARVIGSMDGRGPDSEEQS